MHKRSIAAVGIFLAIVLAGAVLVFQYRLQLMDAGADGRVQVVASFYPLGHFARQVGGEDVQIQVIVPAGAEAHDFEPTPRDSIAVNEADVFVFNGAGIDPWANRVAQSIDRARVTVLDLSQSLAGLWPASGEGHGSQEEHKDETGPEDEARETEELDGYDPHFWIDPVLAEQQVNLIRDALAARDPGHRSAYEMRAKKYAAYLASLNTRYATGLAECRSRDVVVSHNAFTYLAKRYNLTLYPIAGLTPTDEPSPRDLADLIQLVKDKNIQAIYLEPLASPRLVEVLARETGAQVLALNPIEGLTEAEERTGREYDQLMEANLDALRQGLECK